MLLVGLAGGGKGNDLEHLLGGAGRKGAGHLGSVNEEKMGRDSLSIIRLTRSPPRQPEGR
jgi:hypothetical protein